MHQLRLLSASHYYLAILGVDAFADAVDLLVDLGTVMVSLLTGTGHTELNSARMPCSNTGNLTQTFVRLPGQFLAVPSGCYTCNEILISLVQYLSTASLNVCIDKRHQKEGSMVSFYRVIQTALAGADTMFLHHTSLFFPVIINLHELSKFILQKHLI